MLLHQLFETLSWNTNGKRYDAPADYVLVQVRPDELWKHIHPNWLVTNKSPENHIGDRFNRAVKHFNDNQPMDPPVITTNDYDKQYPLDVDNGRHRIAAAVQLGQKWIPVYVHPDQVEKIRKIISIK